jgi:hypothetical protein
VQRVGGVVHSRSATNVDERTTRADATGWSRRPVPSRRRGC